MTPYHAHFMAIAVMGVSKSYSLVINKPHLTTWIVAELISDLKVVLVLLWRSKKKKKVSLSVNYLSLAVKMFEYDLKFHLEILLSAH